MYSYSIGWQYHGILRHSIELLYYIIIIELLYYYYITVYYIMFLVTLKKKIGLKNAVFILNKYQ